MSPLAVLLAAGLTLSTVPGHTDVPQFARYAPLPVTATNVLDTNLLAGMTIEYYLDTIIRLMRPSSLYLQLSAINRETIEQLDKEARHMARQSTLVELFRAHISYDMNGDFTINRSEIEESLRRALPEMERVEALGLASTAADRMDREVEAFMNNDLDGDGTVTLPELSVMADRASVNSQGQPYMRETINALLALDPNGDGRLTTRELSDLAEAYFLALDTNGDLVISEDERKARPSP